MTYEYEKSRDSDALLSDLSAREFQIFCLLAEGLKTNEISKQLNISYKTAANYSTQIKNYPVQGFATADIVPLACINIYNLMREKKVKSLLINTVHDSIIADVYPGEEKIMSDIFRQGTADVIPALKTYYKIDFNVPLDTELKIGYNWLDMKEAI